MSTAHGINPHLLGQQTKNSDPNNPTYASSRPGGYSSVSRSNYVPKPLHVNPKTQAIEVDKALYRAVTNRNPRTSGYRFGMGLRGLISPIRGMRIEDTLGDYGPRVHPVHGGYSYHTGLDFSSPLGTPVYATAGGIVTKAALGDRIYGNQVVLDHGQDQQTMYGHMSKFVVKPGERIKRGQVIGFVGSTGLSSGPHLHWETWLDNKPVSPSQFVVS